jgi:hypothetical protein
MVYDEKSFFASSFQGERILDVKSNTAQNSIEGGVS